MTDLSSPRVPGGGAGKQVSLGGAQTSDGRDGGYIVIDRFGALSLLNGRRRTNLSKTYNALTNKFSFASPLNVGELYVYLTATDSGAGGEYKEVYANVSINAPNDTLAGNWLAETDSESDIVLHFPVPIGKPVIIKLSNANTEVKRVDILPVDPSGVLSNINGYVGGL